MNSDPFDTVGTHVVLGIVTGTVLWILSLIVLPFLFGDGVAGALVWLVLPLPLIAICVVVAVALWRRRREQ